MNVLLFAMIFRKKLSRKQSLKFISFGKDWLHSDVVFIKLAIKPPRPPHHFKWVQARALIYYRHMARFKNGFRKNYKPEQLCSSVVGKGNLAPKQKLSKEDLGWFQHHTSHSTRQIGMKLWIVTKQHFLQPLTICLFFVINAFPFLTICCSI